MQFLNRPTSYHNSLPKIILLDLSTTDLAQAYVHIYILSEQNAKLWSLSLFSPIKLLTFSFIISIEKCENTITLGAGIAQSV
jgi:hypothetical protein